jgi:hypothetical protein
MARGRSVKIIPISFTASLKFWMAFQYAKDKLKQAALLSTRLRTHAELVECDAESSVREQLAGLRSGLPRIPGADTG